ncbi:Uncharacterized protein APZ42_005967, partial [Daphnia magna]
GPVRGRPRPDLVLHLARQRRRPGATQGRPGDRHLHVEGPRPVRDGAWQPCRRQRPRGHRPAVEQVHRRLVRGRQGRPEPGPAALRRRAGGDLARCLEPAGRHQDAVRRRSEEGLQGQGGGGQPDLNCGSVRAPFDCSLRCALR